EADVEEHLQGAVGEVDAAHVEHGQMAPGGSDATDLLVLDDLLDHAVEVSLDEAAGTADDQGPEDAGDGDGHHGPADAVLALDPAQQQHPDQAAHRQEDGDQRLGVRPHVGRNDREQADDEEGVDHRGEGPGGAEAGDHGGKGGHDSAQGEKDDGARQQYSGGLQYARWRSTEVALGPLSVDEQGGHATARLEGEEQAASARAHVPALVEEEGDERRERDQEHP